MNPLQGGISWVFKVSLNREKEQFMSNSQEYDMDLSTSCAAFGPTIMFERLLHHREEIQLLESFAFGLDFPFSACAGKGWFREMM